MNRNEIALVNRIPSREELRGKFRDIDELGLYLHIPFCRQICPYCPYNKEIYEPDMAKRYMNAVKREIDFYSDIIGEKPVTSLYIGGGTPTTMLESGIEDILEHIHRVFRIQCDIHMESHPNDLCDDNLAAITALGVRHLSMGVEALQDRHLRILNRPYTVKQVKRSVEQAVKKGFACVNVDVIFALPGQTGREIEQTGHELVEMGVDQVAAYPLFRFPYTRMGGSSDIQNFTFSSFFTRRKMLGIFENILYREGFERTSVWAFTKSGVPKYCSVTVPLYVGLGASGGSYLKDVFYLNTFNVTEYVTALERGNMAIALSVDLSEEMQMAGWLYWRIYETRFRKEDFRQRFGKDFNSVYGTSMKFLDYCGFLHDDGDRIVFTDKGTYWLHAFEDLFSIDYISKLWGTSKQNPWPQKVVLQG